jgi:hypothetical protein
MDWKVWVAVLCKQHCQDSWAASVVVFKWVYDVVCSIYRGTYWPACGPGSSVGIETDYRLDGLGIESWRGQDFPPVHTGPGARPASCTMGTGSFPGLKYSRGVLLTTHPLLLPRSWKNRAIPVPTLWATTGPVMGTLYLYLFYAFNIIPNS